MAEVAPGVRGFRGRGRLSSIEQLPEVCEEHIRWANEELRERRMPQTEILRQFNARIADHGCKPVSVGTFSRYSLRVATELRKVDAAHKILERVLERLPPEDRNDSTIAAIELVKFRIVELIMDEDPDMGQLAKASLILQRLTSSSVRVSEDRRRNEKADREAEAKKSEPENVTPQAIETADAVERIATEAGLSAERVAAIRRGVLGLQ